MRSSAPGSLFRAPARTTWSSSRSPRSGSRGEPGKPNNRMPVTAAGISGRFRVGSYRPWQLIGGVIPSEMEMRCTHCGAELPGGLHRNWDAVCPICGQLAWLAIGDIVVCRVTSVASFGVFVTFGDGVNGKIHITELTNEAIEHPADVVSTGSMLQAKVLHVDLEKKTVGLSCKR